MPVDSFKWLPRSIAGYYEAMEIPTPEAIPWTPLAKPIEQCRVALVTTAGVYVKDAQPPFDLDRERREPTWGDPSYRAIPADVRQEQIGVAHFHINPEDMLADVDTVLPVHRLRELAEAGEVGSVAPHHYSFMGFQQDTQEWRERYGPEAAQRMVEEVVDAALLAPT